MTTPSREDLFRVGRDEMLRSNRRLSRDLIEREGTDSNAIANAMAAIGDAVGGEVDALRADLFLDTAEDEKLDLLVFDRFNLTRKAAATARGEVQFTTTVATVAPFTIPAGTRVASADGRSYELVSAVTFPAGSVGPITARVRSLVAGLSQQAVAGAIQSIVDTFPGRPATLTVNNSLATAGACNREQDPELRARARLVLPNARRGTLAAIEAGARAQPGVYRATAFEALDALGRPNGMVEVVIADEYTDVLLAVSPTPATYAAQSQALALDVRAALDEVRAAGIYVAVTVASVVMQPVTMALAYRAGFDADETKARAIAAVVSTVNALRPGESLTLAALAAALQRVPGLIVDPRTPGAYFLAPTGTVVPLPLEVLRTSSAFVRVVG